MRERRGWTTSSFTVSREEGTERVASLARGGVRVFLEEVQRSDPESIIPQLYFP